MNFKEAKRRLESLGWVLNRVKGSHYIFRLDDNELNEFILSQHRGDMKQYVIRKLIALEKEFKLSYMIVKPQIEEQIIIDDNLVEPNVQSNIIETHW